MYFKRKTLLFFSIVLAVLLSFSISSFAQEAEPPAFDGDPPIEEETTVEENVEIAPEGEPNGATEGEAEDVTQETMENTTFFARIYEWAEANMLQLSSVAEIAIMAFFCWWSKDKNKTLVSGLLKTVAGQSNVVESSSKVEKATMKMTDEQKAFSDRLRVLEESNEERDKVNKVLVYEVLSLVQLQHTLTLNNANIPQAIKDYSTSLYANCMSAVNNEEALKDAYNKMRDILGIKQEDAKYEENVT